jgi:hypothetical protein
MKRPKVITSKKEAIFKHSENDVASYGFLNQHGGCSTQLVLHYMTDTLTYLYILFISYIYIYITIYFRPSIKLCHGATEEVLHCKALVIVM